MTAATLDLDGFNVVQIFITPSRFNPARQINVVNLLSFRGLCAAYKLGFAIVICHARKSEQRRRREGIASADKFLPEADQRVAIGNQFTAGVTDIAVTDDHGCVIWKNDVYCWGVNDHGQLGSRQLVLPTGAPRKVFLPARPRQIAVANTVSCALTMADEVYCWGADDFGQAGAVAQDSCNIPNGHADAISEPCNLRPVRVPGLP